MPENKGALRTGTTTRREFNHRIAATAISLTLGQRRVYPGEDRISVALFKTTNRRAALGTAIESLGTMDCQGKDVYLKGNYNSADPYPASTHPETLSEVTRILREKGCARLVLVERSGMGQTRAIWQQLSVPDLAKKLDLTLLPLEELPATEWRAEPMPGSHWTRGVEVPRFLKEDVFLVQISNLKTHRFGGQVSASLKNSIGLVAKRSRTGDIPHNYMSELHGSKDQRLMIAEVNQLYAPAFVVMDAMEVFVDGGPESGETASPGIIAASRDRVALDATGLAVLRINGAGYPLNQMAVFEQEQIKRVVELRLGARSPEEIHFITHDQASGALALQIRTVLSQKPEDEKKPRQSNVLF